MADQGPADQQEQEGKQTVPEGQQETGGQDTEPGDGQVRDSQISEEAEVGMFSSLHRTTTQQQNEKEAKKKAADQGSETKSQRLKMKADDKEELDPNMTYDIDEYLVQPMVDEKAGVTPDYANLFYSFSYDVGRRGNLRLIEPNVICQVSGNYLEIVNLLTFNRVWIRSLSGVGIGCFTVHADCDFIALGEKGVNPHLCIYKYPSLELYRLLQAGTQLAYTACEFSPNGEMLASVGSAPDFTLTLWDWRNEQIILRAKAFTQDVYRITWSGDLKGYLTTSGEEHVKFWQMAGTFTGLKLQGSLGKFGKTDQSDVEGLAICPDGKVITGSAWGNLLVWEDGLIKNQIGRKNKRTCHTGQIMQILVDEGEVITIGTDGWVRTWDFELIDSAEGVEEGYLHEMEPMNELQVAPNAQLYTLIRDFDQENPIWFAQDAAGAIWKLDLSFTHTSAAPECVLNFHANSIVDCAVSPFAHAFATIGADGSICVHDILKKQTILREQFNAGGSCILWFPAKDPSDATLLCAGFCDGVVRLLQFGDNADFDVTKRGKPPVLMTIHQVVKPHTRRVTAVSLSRDMKYLATGSEDMTIFFFAVDNDTLNPIGFVNIGTEIVKLDWSLSSQRPSLIVFTQPTAILEIPCPDQSHDALSEDRKSFELTHIQPVKGCQMESIKSKIEHEEASAVKLAKYNSDKLQRMETRHATASHHGEEFDDQKWEAAESQVYQNIMDDIYNWDPTCPEEPSPLVEGYVDQLSPDHVWISTDGFDAGLLYKCKLTSMPTIEPEEEEEQEQDSSLVARLTPSSPLTYKKMAFKAKCCITSWALSRTGRRLVLGLADGSIIVEALSQAFNLSTGKGIWSYRMHDKDHGRVNKIAFTFDDRFIISTGVDGTIFVCELQPESKKTSLVDNQISLPVTQEPAKVVEDIVDPNAQSIEEAKQKAEYDHLVALAEAKKAATRKKLAELRLRLRRIREQNDKLPERIQLTKEDFDLVPELRADLLREREEKIKLVDRETIWQSEKARIGLEKLDNTFRQPLHNERIVVRAFASGHCVTSMRTNKLSEEHAKFAATFSEPDETLTLVPRRSKRVAGEDGQSSLHKGAPTTAPTSGGGIPNFNEELRMSSDTSQSMLQTARGFRVAKKLEHLEDTRKKRELRRAQWTALQDAKPRSDYEDPVDVKVINDAKENMGDFKLKSASNYIVHDRTKLTAEDSKDKLIWTIEESFQLKADFNEQVLNLRDKKVKLVERLQNINKELLLTAQHLPNDESIYLLDVPELQDDEIPERLYSYTEESLMQFKQTLKDNQQSDHQQAQPAVGQGPQVNKQTSQLDSLQFSTLNRSPCKTLPRSSGVKPPPTPANGIGGEGGEIDTNSCKHTVTLTLCDLLKGGYPDEQSAGRLLATHTLTSFNASTEEMSSSSTTPRPFQPSGAINGPHSNRPQSCALLFKSPVDAGGASVQKQCLVDNESIDLTSDAVPITISYESTSEAPETMCVLEHSEDIKVHSQDHQSSSLHPGYGRKQWKNKIANQLEAMHQRNSLLASAKSLVRCFDAEIRLLRHFGIELQLLLKRAELHQFILYKEYRLLKEFEKTEFKLTEKKNSKTEERNQLQTKLTELNQRADKHKSEIDRMTQKDKQMEDEFKATLEDGHLFTDFLLKVYRKHVRRKKPESADRGSRSSGSESSSSSSSSEDSDYDEDSDQDGDDDDALLDLETCPAGCPPTDYDTARRMRERRVSVEIAMGEEKKLLDVVKKELESLMKKSKVVDALYKQAQKELEAFQLEKQKRLNEIETVVIMRLDQLMLHAGQTLPTDLSDGVVFTRSNLHMLRNRIRELQMEKIKQHQQLQEAKAKQLMLQKHRAKFQDELNRMEEICKKEMIIKFGRVESIERMESVMVNPKLEELTARKLTMEAKFEEEEADMEERIRSTRDDCIGELRDNTKYVDKILLLFNEKNAYEASMSQKNRMDNGSTSNLLTTNREEEIEALQKLVREQAKEISLLDKEIAILTRKKNKERSEVKFN